MSMYRSIIAVAVIGLSMASALADELPDAATLEAEGYIIGQVVLDKANVFDLSRTTWPMMYPSASSVAASGNSSANALAMGRPITAIAIIERYMLMGGPKAPFYSRTVPLARHLQNLI